MDNFEKSISISTDRRNHTETIAIISPIVVSSSKLTNHICIVVKSATMSVKAFLLAILGDIGFSILKTFNTTRGQKYIFSILIDVRVFIKSKYASWDERHSIWIKEYLVLKLEIETLVYKVYVKLGF